MGLKKFIFTTDLISIFDKTKLNAQTLDIMREPTNIFISYRHQTPDDSIANQFKSALEEAGHDVFIDKSISWGSNWVREIQNALERANFLLLLLSKEAAESEMVIEEVTIAKELARKNGGKPIILPIRLKLPFSEPLAYNLSAYLRSIQQEIWMDDTDTTRLIGQLLKLMRKPSGWLNGEKEHSSPQGIKGDKPQPHFDPRDFILPGGAIDVESKCYVSRRGDEQVLNEMRRSRVMITVQGPRQIGKTSLIMRAFINARQLDNNLQASFIDFQAMPPEQLKSLNSIWRAMAMNIGEQIQLLNWHENEWKSELSHDRNFTSFLESYVFKASTSPLVLCLDEVDKIFNSPIKTEFFASIRAFYNRGAYDRSWRKIYWLLSTSTEPSFFIEDLTQSPFNIGLKVELGQFTPNEIDELGNHLNTNINSKLRNRIIRYTGGQPFLVHTILYHLRQNPESKEELFNAETAGGGIFRQHLHRYLMQFQREEKLAQAMRTVINGRGCSNAKLAIRLESAGLARHDKQERLIPFCELYSDFFKSHLL